jgi:hypothetical protein
MMIVKTPNRIFGFRNRGVFLNWLIKTKRVVRWTTLDSKGSTNRPDWAVYQNHSHALYAFGLSGLHSCLPAQPPGSGIDRG